MDGEDWFTLTVMFTKANGKMIKLMEKEFTNTLMVLNTMETGKKISKTDMELKHGQMAQSMMALM